MQFFSFLLALGLLLAVSSCSHQAAQPMGEVSSVLSSPRAFDKLVDEYFNAMYDFYPTYATLDGLHDRDERIENRSQEAIMERIEDLKDVQKELSLLSVSELSFDQQIDFRIISDKVYSEIYSLNSMKLWQSNPLIYAIIPGEALGSIIKRDYAPAKERLRSLISRMKAIPQVYQAARTNLKTSSPELSQIAITVADGSLGYFSNDVAKWAKIAADGDSSLWSEFEIHNKALIQSATDFSIWLKTDLFPRSTSSFAIGKDAFETLLRYNEMIEAPLSEVLARGETNLKKDYDSFVATAKLIDSKKSPIEVMRLLSNEHPTAEELIPAVRKTVEDARKFVVDLNIVTIPSEVRPIVEETPIYSRTGTFASMSTPGPFETQAQEAYYYVTPVEKNWTAKHKEEHLRGYNPYVVAIVNVHEAYPGHFLQFLYVKQFPTKTRRILSTASNTEGWAHYTEQMMVDQGFGNNNPKIRLAQLQEALLRDCRYIVGIKMHTEGWTIKQGAEFFEKFGFQEPANALAEANRGAYDPTYLYYTYGKLEILKLRDEYLKQTGKSLKDFHDAFVLQGAIPIPLVRKVLLSQNAK